jgi:NAD+ kinase
MMFKRIGCIADSTSKAKIAYAQLKRHYDLIDMQEDTQPVDVIIVLGGDGFMLHVLHKYSDLNIPFYGMNSGTVGFLMNNFTVDNLPDRLEKAESAILYPLHMVARQADGTEHHALAINEVSLLRETNQAAKIRISIDGAVRMEEMIGDGVLLATSAGSSAYNLSAGGMIVPMGSDILSLTPINPFRPRRWRGALLPHTAKVRFDITAPDKRPVSATADFIEVRDIDYVEVWEDRSRKITLLFDADHSLEERIIREQFVP